MSYVTDPNDVEDLVDAIKAFFVTAADHESVDVGWAVELLTSVVRLVDPNYSPPEPAESET